MKLWSPKKTLAVLFSITLCVMLVSMPSQAADSQLTAAERRDHYNLERNNLALGGYDPVSYHQNNGPQKGNNRITTTYRGIVYRFQNQTNKNTFLADSESYEPAYGGWCAWAMLDGDEVDVNHETYLIIDGTVYLFYDGWLGDTRRSWRKKIQEGTRQSAMVADANREWAGIVN